MGVDEWLCVFLKEGEEIVVKGSQSSCWEVERQEIVAGGAVAVHGHSQLGAGLDAGEGNGQMAVDQVRCG